MPESPNRAFALDPLLGRVFVPGRHPGQGAPYTIEADGGRDTGGGEAAGRPEIWIFGCSWTFGSGEPDETVFCSVLQRRLPGLRIRNYGVPGYGTVHNLLDLRRRAARGKPAQVVFVYGAFHWKRNVPALDWVRRYAGNPDRGLTHFPRARLDKDGRLSVDVIEVKPEHAALKIGNVDPRLIDPDEFTQVQATLRLIAAATQVTGGLGVPFTLAQLTADPDPATAPLRQAGLVPLMLDKVLEEFPPGERWNGAKHPKAAMHDRYADCLEPVLAARLAA